MRPSVRAFWGGFWAPFPSGFRDLGLSEGFTSGLLEGGHGRVRLSELRGGLLGSLPKQFPSIWTSWKGALALSGA